MGKMKAKLNDDYAVISVSAGKGCYRHIRVPVNRKLSWLADFILDCFEFDHDHMYAFFMNNRTWDGEEAYFLHPDRPFVGDVDKCKLTEAGITAGKQFKFLYDFGDEWVFQCRVLRTENTGSSKGEILRSVGDSPEQYYYPEDDFSDEYDEDYEHDIDDLLNMLADDGDDDDYWSEDEMYGEVTEGLFSAAVEFNRASSNRKSYFNNVVAVKLSSGEDGYITYVSTDSGPAIHFFKGQDGWNMYSVMFDQAGNKHINDAVMDEMAEVFNCIFLSSSDIESSSLCAAKEIAEKLGITLRKYPVFARREPMYAPGPILDTDDAEDFEEAIRALTYVCKNYKKYSQLINDGMMYGRLLYIIPEKDGFRADETDMPKAVLPAVSSPKVKTKKLPKCGNWACEITSSRSFGNSDFDFEPHFFYALAFVRTDGKGCFNNKIFDLDCDYGDIVRYIADEFNRMGYYPEEISVRTKFTGAVLSNFCKSAGIKLNENDNVPELDNVLDSDECNPVPDMNDENGYDVPDGINEAELEFMMNYIEQYIAGHSVSELKRIPSDEFKIMKEMYEAGVFSPENMEKLKKIFR